MDRRLTLLSANPHCLEGLLLQRRGMELQQSTKLSTQFFGQLPEDPERQTAPASSFATNLQSYLQSHRVSEPGVIFLIPTQEVTFRTLEFPFQDARKIAQVLPFELGNEIIGHLEDYHFSYQLRLQQEGGTQAFVQLLAKERREQLLEICAAHQWQLQGLHSTAVYLCGLLPKEWQRGWTFQVYVGIDESFVSLLEEGQLIVVKPFSHRLLSLLQKETEISVSDFLVQLRSATANDSVLEELRWLCSQITLFVRAHSNTDAGINLSLHGVFAELLDWDGQRFRVRVPTEGSPFTLETAESTPAAITSAENSPAASTFRTMPASLAEVRLRRNQIPNTREPWGLLGETPPRFRNFFERHPLNLFAQGTPLQRFLKQNRWGIVAASFFAILAVGMLIGNHYLQFQARQQQLTQLEGQLRLQASQTLQDPSLRPDQVMNRLQNLIAQHQQQLALSEKFSQRSYTNLLFLKNMANLMESEASFSLDRIEFSSDRFSMNGAIDSYENLQKLKSRLQELPEFQEKRIVESNRKSQEGILYRITVDL